MRMAPENNSRRAYAGNRPADNQGGRRGGNSADEGAHLEDAEGAEIDPLDGVEGVQLSEHQLEGACCEQVRATRTSPRRPRRELVGDLGMATAMMVLSYTGIIVSGEAFA